jgi:predicted NBD/HSP70 family sugar kinase
MSDDHQAITGETLTAAEIAAKAESGDGPAQATIDRYVDRLARGLAHVMNLIDPDVIILGGGLSNLALLYDAVPARWGRYVFSDVVATRLVPPVHGDSSGVRGAAWLWPAE